MRRGASGSGLTPNSLSAPGIPSRRSSAVELYSIGQHASNSNVASSSGASLGNSLVHYSSLGGSRSAATSPVGGSSAISSSLSINKDGNGSVAGASAGGSPNRSNRTSNEAWVCPNDRQLLLRAKYFDTLSSDEF